MSLTHFSEKVEISPNFIESIILIHSEYYKLKDRFRNFFIVQANSVDIFINFD